VHSRCFGIMGGHGNFVIELNIEIRLCFSKFEVKIASMSSALL
jgi:hypothetical protein